MALRPKCHLTQPREEGARLQDLSLYVIWGLFILWASSIQFNPHLMRSGAHSAEDLRFPQMSQARARGLIRTATVGEVKQHKDTEPGLSQT